MSNSTSKNQKVLRTGTLALRELQTIFRRLNVFSNWKAGIFIRILMDDYGHTARSLERKTGFSHTYIQTMADTINLGEGK